MSISETAPARVGAAVGRLLDPSAVTYLYDFCARKAEKMDHPRLGAPATAAMLTKIQEWFDANVPPAAMATEDQMKACEAAISLSSTWICSDNGD